MPQVPSTVHEYIVIIRAFGALEKLKTTFNVPSVPQISNKATSSYESNQLKQLDDLAATPLAPVTMPCRKSMPVLLIVHPNSWHAWRLFDGRLNHHRLVDLTLTLHVITDTLYANVEDEVG